MKKIYIIIILVLSSVSIIGQNKTDSIASNKKSNHFFIGIEVGIRTYLSIDKDYDFIRQSATYSYNHTGGKSGLGLTTRLPLFAFKLEHRFLTDRFWISTGIGYSQMNITLEKEYDYRSNNNFFYILLNNDNNNSYYYRIESVKEVNNYISVPFDIRFHFIKTKSFSVFARAGFRANFLVYSQQSAILYDKDMQYREDAVLDLFEKPDNFYTSFNAGYGVQFGKKDKLKIKIELDFPVAIYPVSAFGLMTVEMGVGLRFSLVFPLKFNEQ